MGAKQTKQQGADLGRKDLKIINVIDYISSKYITQASFQELTNLHNPKYCKKLVILTSKVIKHFLNNQEITYMDQRTKKGAGGREVINKMATKNVIHLDKDDLDRLDISSGVRKKRMCIGIAKFYIKIAHLFAAIATTINPRYTYTTATGEKKTVSLNEKQYIPKNLHFIPSKLNFCSERIKAIKTRQNNANGIVIRVKNCNMNKKTSDSVDNIPLPVPSVQTKTLIDEPGIPELELLYYDDYDYNNGSYIGMTDEGQKVYNADLLKFYTALTGQKQLPPNITKFSQIELPDFHNQELCKDKDSPWHRSYKGKPSDKLFKQYAEHIKQMTTQSQSHEQELLDIIKKLFAYWLDPKKQEKILTINPDLNEKSLQDLVVKARKYIIELYINCETDFQKGLQLFEAIVKAKMLETSQRRIKGFGKKVDELVDTEKKAPAVQAKPVNILQNKPDLINTNINIQITDQEQPLVDAITTTTSTTTPATTVPPATTAPATGGSRKRRSRKKK